MKIEMLRLSGIVITFIILYQGLMLLAGHSTVSGSITILLTICMFRIFLTRLNVKTKNSQND